MRETENAPWGGKKANICRYKKNASGIRSNGAGLVPQLQGTASPYFLILPLHLPGDGGFAFPPNHRVASASLVLHPRVHAKLAGTLSASSWHSHSRDKSDIQQTTRRHTRRMRRRKEPDSTACPGGGENPLLTSRHQGDQLEEDFESWALWGRPVVRYLPSGPNVGGGEGEWGVAQPTYTDH